ncbi:MAG: DUF2207 domain-containing protein, partial [Chloroflexi bacterium]|nr:DUF2207 domain-containing protein [Chloroflexota bacterium]
MRWNLIRVLSLTAFSVVLSWGWGWIPIKPVAATSNPVTVSRRDGEFEILTDGRVRARETWVVTFHGGPYRYAYRSIPLHKVEAITDIQVLEDGRPYQKDMSEAPGTYQVLDDGEHVTIRWYFEPTTDATRTFVLEYTLVGALWIHPDGDQFYWQFIEEDRGYPIEASRVLLLLPANFSPEQVRLETSSSGSEPVPSRAALQDDGRTALFEGGPFPPNTGWAIRAQWPHGYVNTAPPSWQRTAMWRPYLVLGGTVLLILGGLGLVLAGWVTWYTKGRDPTAISVPRVTKPPTDDPPGVVGILVDEKGSQQETVATLLDLAQRGHVRFEEHKGELVLVRQSSTQPLRPFEQRFLERLFGPRTVIRQAELQTYLPSAHSRLIADLYDEAKRRGYFPLRPDRVRMAAFVLGIILVALYEISIIAFVFWAFPNASFLPCLVMLLGVLGLVGVSIWARAMPRRTVKGARAAALWRGFKRYLETLDNWRGLKSEEAARVFETYLPYATALGLENKWVRMFARQDVPAPPWWGAPRPSPSGDLGPMEPSRPTRPGPIFSGPVGPQPQQPWMPSGGSIWKGLDGMANGTFAGLDSISDTLLGALNTVASSTRPPSSSGGGGWSGGG